MTGTLSAGSDNQSGRNIGDVSENSTVVKQLHNT